MTREQRERKQALLIRALIPARGLQPLDLLPPPTKTCLQIPSHGTLGSQLMNFGRAQAFYPQQTNADVLCYSIRW